MCVCVAHVSDKVLTVCLRTAVAHAADELWDNEQAQLWHRLLEGASSPMCEILGLQQRQWLQQLMQASTSALNIIASGSVLAGACVIWWSVYQACDVSSLLAAC